MIRWLFLLAALSGTATAETARVISGEHADFTRLVVELPEAEDWTVGRTAMGYGFMTLAPAQPGYDLSGVWDRIPRSRLQSLRVDPGSGALTLALACDCHVFPFEVEPGMIVLDVRAGPAPPGSVFETTMALAAPSQPRDQPPLAPTATFYDWLGQPLMPPKRASGAPLHFSPAKANISLDPLRDELLLQLSRGAADGVVDMMLPGKAVEPEVEGMGDLSGALIRIGELPGLEVGGPSDKDEGARDRCLQDEMVDLSGWGDGRPPLDLLAEARSGLYEEFDEESSKALGHAVRLHLYLGFGAEARQYGALMTGAESDPAMAPLLSIARLIDGEVDPTSPFVPMLGCDGTAALWAVLAHSSLPAGALVDTDAVVRSFQALPPHLRRHLGPRLTSLLQGRDAEAARMIRDAVERTADVPAGTVALIDARAELQALRPDAALGHAESAVQANGSGLDGLVALVEAHFQSGAALSPDVADALMALHDVASEDAARRERAVILALALSGQVEPAFGLAGPDHPDGADLWKALAQHADDKAFLGRAVLPPAASPPDVAVEVGLAIATRLADLGFHEAALAWLGPIDPDASPERRMLAADARLALGDARGALRLLSGLSSPEARALQAGAYQQLGAFDAARQALVGAGKPEMGARLASWDGDWDALKAEGSPAWAEAASLVDPARADAAGPLAQGRAALEDSAAARSAIAALLAEVPPQP